MKTLWILGIIFLIFSITVGPFLTIWSLNTLFGLEIALTLKTWLSVVWLLIILKANTTKNGM